MSHGLPIAESRDKVKILVKKKHSLWREIDRSDRTFHWNSRDLLYYDLFAAINRQNY